MSCKCNCARDTSKYLDFIGKLTTALIIIYREIVNQLIETPQWPLLMRQTVVVYGKKTTPFREMIRKMPGKHILIGQQKRRLGSPYIDIACI